MSPRTAQPATEKARRTFTRADDDYIRTHYPHGCTRAIAEHLGRKPQRIRTRAHEIGVAKAPGAKAKRTGMFTPAMDDALRRIYADHTNRELAERMGVPRHRIAERAHQLGLKKARATKSRTYQEMMLSAGRRKGQFESGGVPWNRGRTGYSVATGWMHYKPGNRPPKWVPVGTERLTPMNKSNPAAPRYLKRKVADPDVWQWVHHIVWTAAHGPVPAGHVVVFADGNTANITLANLRCIRRADLALASCTGIPYDLTGAWRALGDLQKAIKESTR